MRSSRKVVGVAVLACGALALAACSSSPSATGTSTKSHSHHATHRSTTTTTSTSTTTTTTTTTTAPTTTCQVSGLHIARVGAQGAAGTAEITYALTNTGSATCTTYGYPGMLLLSASGSPLPTTVDRGGAISFEDIAPATVQLAPGKTAYFNVGYSDVPTGSSPQCSTAVQVEITPPTNTTHVTLPATGLVACENGTLHVSAVFGATNASATQTTAPTHG